ncbi:hypothetical protein [Parvularcula sp. IMCC14364]|uniref:hypothetical protein n=1 Tax=Parvularcula sp. IMCC14364 TaxID=3067902 RepID=UPI002740B619|nr:hypothetical protein [Parvularcula sp. IMCC14364]
MIRILSEEESEPASRPALDSDLFTAVGTYGPDGNSVAAYHSFIASHAAHIPQEHLWQRIESYIAFRWGVRTVVWIVEGPGTFETPLKPATVSTTEIWQNEAWASVTLKAAPLGYVLEDATYRFTASVGTGDVPPAIVQEAIRRLAFYAVETWQQSGGWTGLGDGQTTVPSWPARSMQYSGAADLLRPYRRLGAYQCA